MDTQVWLEPYTYLLVSSVMHFELVSMTDGRKDLIADCTPSFTDRGRQET